MDFADDFFFWQYFSEFSEAYVVPGDISSKGCDFLAEAERLKAELPMQPSLASLQGTLLMYERCVETCVFRLIYVMTGDIRLT